MTTNTKRIVTIIGIVICILILFLIVSNTFTTEPTTSKKNDSVYNVDLQTVVEIHYKHVEKGEKLVSNVKAVYEAKTEGIIIYTVQSDDGMIVDRVAFVLDELWEALK